MNETVALVVGAGEGRRFGGEVPKQYYPLSGVAVMRRSLLAFLEHPDVTAVRAVIHPGHGDLYDQAVDGLDLLPPVHGGVTRQQSVALGLESLAGEPPSRVLIHDAARPLVAGGVISRVLAALDRSPGAIPALPVADTLKLGDGGTVAATIDRQDLWRAQTPQGFRFDGILAAHRAAEPGHTDDASVARAAGLAVAAVAGAAENQKITTAEDLARADRALSARMFDVRVGQGFDVHRFEDGARVRLCGVDIPHDAALAGHSDADVALHAVTDAILGAIGDGDIGRHFPPGEARWRDADSAHFVAFAVERVAAIGGRLAHIDLTIICEAPRIAPHHQAMADRLAAITGLDGDRVSVKATTTDRLGFSGRGEGIAAQAVATVVLG